MFDIKFARKYTEILPLVGSALNTRQDQYPSEAFSSLFHHEGMSLVEYECAPVL